MAEELTPVQWMDKSVNSLYLELPDAIADDVKKRWQAAKEYLSGEDWISVKDRLPEQSGQVLGCMKDTLDIYVCFYKPGQKLFQVWGAGFDPINDMKVTHWMPLPEPPKP